MKLLPCPNECGVAIAQKLGEGGASVTIDTPTFQSIGAGGGSFVSNIPHVWNMYIVIVHSLTSPPPGVFHQRALDHDPHHM